MAPENGCLEDKSRFLLGKKHIFRGEFAVSFREGRSVLTRDLLSFSVWGLGTGIFWHTSFGPPNGALVREIPLISGKSRLVKYYNLAICFPPKKVGGG